MNIKELVKDLVKMALDSSKEAEQENYELLFVDAFKRGYMEGMVAEHNRILELIKK